MESRTPGVRPAPGDLRHEGQNGRGTVVAWSTFQQRAVRGLGSDSSAERAVALDPPLQSRNLPQRLPVPVEPAGPEVGVRDHDAGRCDLLIAMAAEESRRARFDEAERSLHEAALIAERIGDRARLGRAVVAMPGWNLATPEAPNPLVRLLAERTLGMGEIDPGPRAMLTARLAAEIFSYPGHIYRSDRRRSLKLDESALEVAAAAHDSRVELYVRCCRDRLLRHVDCLAERLSNAEEILRLGLKNGDYSACHLGAVAQSAALAGLGRTAEAHQVARLADGIARMSQIPVHAGSSLAYQAACAVMSGRFADAREAFARCRNLAGRDLPHLLDGCWPLMLTPLDESGQLSEIESAAEDTVRRRPGIPVFQALLGWIRARTGRSHDALFCLEHLGADGFLGVSKSEASLVTLAALAEVCVQLGRTDYAALIYQRLAPYAGLVSGIGSIAIFGSVELHLGRLAHFLGRQDAAIVHFQNAIETNRLAGARSWTLYSSYELARALSIRGAAPDKIRARELIEGVEGEARELDVARLASRAKEIRERLESAEVSPVAPRPGDGADAVRRADGAASGTHEARPAAASPPAPAPANGGGSQAAIFRREGEYWLIGFQPRTFPLKHRTGLALIHHLIRNPGREICATDLGVGDQGGARSMAADTARNDSAPVLDASAKQSYRVRLIQLREDLERAHEFNDFERAGNIEQEIDFITRELARALGLAGRDRKFGSETERARKRVSLAIKEAIRVIARHDAALGRHLMRSVKTGKFCSYTSEPPDPLQWRL